MVRIKDIKTFLTCPYGINLVVVRVETDQPGLYGLGCATFTQRCKAVITLIDEYIKPLLAGRDVSELQELWTLMNHNAYWRNGPVVNVAMGGVDLALWDIKGKMAGMPVYELLGGKCREGAPVYCYANGDSKGEILDKAQALWEEGCRYIRLQTHPFSSSGPLTGAWHPKNAKQGPYVDGKKYIRYMMDIFECCRDKMGFEPELLHDVHERLSPVDAVYFAQEAEPIRLYFLEDLFAPDQIAYFRRVRNLCSTPLSQGELCVNPMEWLPLVSERLIDYMRIHTTMIGGLTPALRCAHMCELYGIRTSWHAPWDLNPVGHAAQIHLDLCSPNAGVQEWSGMNEAEYELFPGAPVTENGFAYVNDKPGFGVEFDEALARKYPPKEEIIGWTQLRQADGSLVPP